MDYYHESPNQFQFFPIPGPPGKPGFPPSLSPQHGPSGGYHHPDSGFHGGGTTQRLRKLEKQMERLTREVNRLDRHIQRIERRLGMSDHFKH